VTSLVANAAYNLGVFCNLIPSDIWPDKRGGLLDTPVSSTNKTGCHDITEILLKVALNPITVNNERHQFSYNIITSQTKHFK
jgi:hypothetical protein